ncbi:MAG: hypothetical protein R2681_03510 [Pyrinomonadaceae bacterium]
MIIRKFFFADRRVVVVFTVLLTAVCSACTLLKNKEAKPLAFVTTVAGSGKEFGEPFGIAERDGDLYVSDGEKGVIWQIRKDGKPVVFADEFDTPSQIAFDLKGDLFVADTGTHTIKKVSKDGTISLVAGVEGNSGFLDGDAGSALFNAPIGLAVFEEKIFVADTYNDRIRVIENGKVATLAGGVRGYSDSRKGIDARFDTPCGLAIWNKKLLVADSQNHRLRVVEPDGNTWTLAGSGVSASKDGLLSEGAFVEPFAVAAGTDGEIYIADRNSVRVIGRRMFPVIESLSGKRPGFADGASRGAKFNRISGITGDSNGNLFVTDSENSLVRAISSEKEIGSELSDKNFDKIQITAKEFREMSPGRWPYDPPEKTREIAATFGEIRGEMEESDSDARFHNGLDIVGGYGEKATFIRDGKILRPQAVQLFETTSESIFLPALGYVHIRIGRDAEQVPFKDKRYLFEFDTDGNPSGVRIPRGTRFKAGEVIGTLNRYNHVHLIAGRPGREMNALDALSLPGVSDSRLPVIQKISFFDERWREFETGDENSRIELSGKTRIVVEAFDQMDGNADRRKLGIYRLGYQILAEDESMLPEYEKTRWTIRLLTLPDPDTVKLVFARGSKSGATGETIFRYIVTNEVDGRKAHESFFDAGKLETGKYIVRAFAADFFGNVTSKDIVFYRK